MKKTLDIIIPTWNNPEYLNPCIRSIIDSGILNGLGRLIIVNNGKQPIKELVKDYESILVLEPGENLGWEKGLEYGLRHSESPFVCFQNDDTLIPLSSTRFYEKLLLPFADPSVGAVGPATTIAAGWHSVFNQAPLRTISEVPFLIFFTVVVRRSTLDFVGGVDVTAPGGDDFDLSIRIRKANQKLLITPEAFIIHHAFKTGTRVHGDHTVSGGWNSEDKIEKTNKWLIQKHGFKAFFQTITSQPRELTLGEARDVEGEMVRGFVEGDTVLEMGCGGVKTVERAIGVDWVEPGETVPHLHGEKSVADIVASVDDLPIENAHVDCIIARHILEHLPNSVKTLKEWNRVLKMDGQLVIAVPDQEQCNSIPMNPEHVHGFTKESLKDLLELVGFRVVESQSTGNNISFVCVSKKVREVSEILQESVLA